MYNEVRYLYKDDSGNLDLEGRIGKCRIYITDDAFETINPFFVVESLNQKYRFTFTLFWITDAGEICFNEGKYSKKQFDKIYNYIINERDYNGNIKWINMISSVGKPRLLEFRRGIPDEIKYSNKPSFKFGIDTREVIFTTNLMINNNITTLYIGNDYVSHPILHIKIGDGYSKESLMKLDTKIYYGGYILNKEEHTKIIDYLYSKSLTDGEKENYKYILSLWNFHFKSTFGNDYEY